MTRREEIEKAANEFYKGDEVSTFVVAAQWADKTMIEKACRCYCDDICDKGRCCMCFHKHDGKGQVKNNFQYNALFHVQPLFPKFHALCIFLTNKSLQEH